MGLHVFLFLFVVVVGAAIGSFLNVCIYRLPLEKSIFWPGSHCPKCLRPVRAYDNIPILSWLLLRGRCRHCGEPFSARYLWIEALTAAMFGFVYWVLAPAAAADYWRYAYFMILIAALIAATFIDLDLQVIPDSVTVPGMIVGLVGGTLIPSVHFVPMTEPAPEPAGMGGASPVVYASLVLVGWGLWAAAVAWQVHRGLGGPAELVILAVSFLYLAGHSAWLGLRESQPAWPGWQIWLTDHPRCQGLATSVLGFLVGAAIVWIVRVIGTAALAKEAMGFGDVTLMAMVGAFLGWQPVALVFFAAPFFGLVVGLVQWLGRGNHVLPYGPYLALASLIVILFWSPIWAVAQNHFRVLGLIPAPVAIAVILPAVLVCVWTNERRAARAAATSGAASTS